MDSYLYKELTDAELARIIDEALHTGITASKLLTGGLFNTTYLVDTADCGRVVLRVGPVNRHLLMPFEHELMEAEEHAYARCRERGIPVSEVLAMDTTKKAVGRDYMIVRYIPSKPLLEVELEPEDRARICRDIGAATRQMHGIESPRFGRIADVKKGKGFDRWSDCLLDELKKWESVARPAQLFETETFERVEKLFEKMVPYLDEVETAHLVHTDLWVGNVLISTDSERPEFAAIIDADRGMWGDPEQDFSSIRWTYSEPTFWEGYGKPLSQDPHDVIRRTAYTLLWNLLDTYVFDQEYIAPESAAANKEEALRNMALLEQLLNQSN